MTIPGMTEEEKEREKDLQQTLTKIAQEQKNITETVGRLRNRLADTDARMRNRLADLDAKMREACKNRRRQKPSLVRNVKNRLSRIASRIADRLAE